MVIAAQCVPVASSWVHQFVLTCDDELAVQFRNGVCCLYPGTTRALFHIALVWGSPGKFVHAFLYKIRPYRLIVPPCPAQDCGGGVQTACCPLPVPTTLHATITGGGACDGSYQLVYQPAVAEWAFTGTMGTCNGGGMTTTIGLICAPGDVWREITLGGSAPATSATCSPFVLTFSGLDLTACGGTTGATMTVTT